MFWPTLTTNQVKTRVFAALASNSNYRNETILGIPATFLDTDIFYDDAPFLKDAPFLSLMVANPNHIGCHTLEGDSEHIFKGTQELESDLIRICAEQIFSATPGSYDGYVATGGTEANIEAIWIYRNYFITEKKANHNELALVYSEDSHYSFSKAANLLQVREQVMTVNGETRELDPVAFAEKLNALWRDGIRYLIININAGTTMFGSIDNINMVTDLLDKMPFEYKLHIDAAFGGFIYPFTMKNSSLDFANPKVSSVTIDGHKLLQAPYGTGIFLVRKNMMKYVCTDKASYVQGKDYTLCGSRSGANAVSVWMILHIHGSVGWGVKMAKLLDKTSSLCNALENLNVEFYRNSHLNIIAIKSKFITPGLARRYCLVPDNYDNPAWYKIVIMSHVKQGTLDGFVSELEKEITTTSSK